ncbi:MAG: hypothetical protein M3N18_04535 [Actinomycetota bacterium]|nr:hypothetical protein [Actinomycetota bacterium]
MRETCAKNGTTAGIHSPFEKWAKRDAQEAGFDLVTGATDASFLLEEAALGVGELNVASAGKPRPDKVRVTPRNGSDSGPPPQGARVALVEQPEQESYRHQDGEDYHKHEKAQPEPFKHPGRTIRLAARRPLL